MSRRIILNRAPVARTALGIEDYELEGALEPMDEVQSAIDMTEQANAAQSDLDTADTLAYRAEALEDLVSVAETTPEASENDLVLSEIVSDLATQGTDLQTDSDVLPALESYVGKSISTEGIKETIASMLKALVEFMKNAWQNIKAFFGNVDAQVATLKKKLKEIASSAADGVVPASTMNKDLFLVVDDGETLRLSEPQYIMQHLSDQKLRLSKIFSKHAALVLTLSQESEKGIKKAQGTFDKLMGNHRVETNTNELKEVEQAAIAVHKSLLAMDGMELYGKTVINATGKDDVKASEIGGGIFSPSIEDNSAEICSASVAFEKLTPGEKEESKEMRITAAETKAYCDALLMHLDYLDGFRKEYFEKFSKFFALNVSDLTVKMGQKEIEDTNLLNGKVAAKGFGMVIRYNRFTARCIAQPFTTATSAVLTAVRGHVGVLSGLKGGSASKEVAKA